MRALTLGVAFLASFLVLWVVGWALASTLMEFEGNMGPGFRADRILEEAFGSLRGALRFRGDEPLKALAVAVGLALELNPRVGEALRDAGHEVAGHGWRWIDHHGLPEDVEREHIRRTAADPGRAT